ncbi:MAG TPA: CdaR family protein, partial [Paenibacillus sp.]|nr:CdaR family protein [Paenibacillus sp.]
MDNWLRNNNIIRIVAVVVGLLLWVIVRLDVQNASGPTQPTTVSQTYTNQSVQVVGLDEERYTLLSYEPTKVSITVIGTAAALRRVEIEDYKVILDLTDVQAGEHLVSLTHEGFPSNVQVVLDPPNVSVSLDEKERKEVPVTINIIGSPADGFTAGEPIAQPNRVNVTVSSSLADQVASVVGLIDIDGATESVKQQVKLVALDQEGTELDVAVTPAVVDVEMPVTSPFKTVP